MSADTLFIAMYHSSANKHAVHSRVQLDCLSNNVRDWQTWRRCRAIAFALIWHHCLQKGVRGRRVCRCKWVSTEEKPQAVGRSTSFSFCINTQFLTGLFASSGSNVSAWLSCVFHAGQEELRFLDVTFEGSGPSCCRTDTTDEANTWHRRVTHLVFSNRASLETCSDSHVSATVRLRWMVCPVQR